VSMTGRRFGPTVTSGVGGTARRAQTGGAKKIGPRGRLCSHGRYAVKRIADSLSVTRFADSLGAPCRIHDANRKLNGMAEASVNTIRKITRSNLTRAAFCAARLLVRAFQSRAFSRAGLSRAGEAKRKRWRRRPRWRSTVCLDRMEAERPTGIGPSPRPRKNAAVRNASCVMRTQP
jgi:hypothetical protein